MSWLCLLQLSVVEYDPGTHDLKTLSLHFFEEPELRVRGNELCLKNIQRHNLQITIKMSIYEKVVSYSIIFLSPGWVCPEPAHPHGPCGPREPLCCDAGVWHPAGGAAIQKGHTY